MMQRYRLRHGTRRITVSLGYLVTELLAIKLGYRPDTDPADRAIQQWLQHRLDVDNDPGRCRVQRWLQSEVTYFLADEHLVERHGDWLLSQIPELSSMTHQTNSTTNRSSI